MKPNTNEKDKSVKSLPKVSHYGTIDIDDLALECVVLEDGTRGYVQDQLLQTLGFRGHGRMPHFQRFLDKIAPNVLNLIGKSDATSVIMPSGGNAKFLPAGILSDIADGVIGHALAGTLHAKRKHLIPNCRAILKAFAKTGEVALIDEVTGYQYQRAPDALQQTAKAAYIDAAKMIQEAGFKCSAPNNIAIKKDIAQFLDIPESTLDSFLRKHKTDIKPIKLDRATIRSIGFKASTMNGYSLDDVTKVALGMDSIMGMNLKKQLFGQVGPFIKLQTPVQTQWHESFKKIFADLGLNNNYKLGPYQVDFFVAKLLLVLECNGYCHRHYDVAQEKKREAFITKKYGLVRFHHTIDLETLFNGILQTQPGKVVQLYDLQNLSQEMPLGLNISAH